VKYNNKAGNGTTNQNSASEDTNNPGVIQPQRKYIQIHYFCCPIGGVAQAVRAQDSEP
jgi:hypothetical protein